MITLSRNTPVAFVVGAAGFIGSHLVDKLLEKRIQVVGVDDLSTGLRGNLEEAIKNKNFHFLNQSGEETIPFEFSRLDYAFFTITGNSSFSLFQDTFDNFLEICKISKPKIILVSTIDLYDSKNNKNKNLNLAEQKLAKLSSKIKTNARILRLSTIYGPRMNFRGDDPITRLIRSTISGGVQKESMPLDFTTRALFIDDAVNLLIKAVMHGSTAQKIYDGALSNPIKVTEIKQILLDPIWHETRGFEPTQLPPWPTPNLIKTEKELSWKVKTSIVSALKHTICYFKERPDFKLPEVEDKEDIYSNESAPKIISSLKTEQPNGRDTEIQIRKLNLFGINFDLFKNLFYRIKKNLVITIGFILIGYTLIYPAYNITFGLFAINGYLNSINQSIENGDLDGAREEAKQARKTAENLNNEIKVWDFFDSIPVLKDQIQTFKQTVNILTDLTKSVEHISLGLEAFDKSMRIVSGEKDEDLVLLLNTSYWEMAQAEKTLNNLNGVLSNQDFIDLFPDFLKAKLSDLTTKVDSSYELSKQFRIVTSFMPQLLSVDDKKTYLVLLQNNSSLRPGGGKLTSYAEILLDRGTIKTLNSGTIDTLDRKLTDVVKTTEEIKNDTGEASRKLKNSNMEADGPSNSQLAAWFYYKETGIKVSGVIVLDFTALSLLMNNFEVEDASGLEQNLVFTQDNNLLQESLKDLLNKIFFLSSYNRISFAKTLGQQIKEKHITAYIIDPVIFAYSNSEDWNGAMKRQKTEVKGEKTDLLALSETNITGNNANYYLQREINLESNIDENGGIKHKLTIDYSSGVDGYNQRLKIYLPSGSKLNKVLWGKEDILKKVTQFSDYGRASYSMSLTLQANAQKRLSLEYQDLKPVVFDNNILNYKLQVLKQPGTGKDKFGFAINYPASLEVISDMFDQQLSNNISVSTDLSEDQDFEIVFQKKS